MRNWRWDAKILVFHENEEINYDNTADCVMKVENNSIYVEFPALGSTANFECVDTQQVEIFVEQLKEAICGEAIRDIDIAEIKDNFNQVEKGEFYSKEISLTSISAELENIKNKVNEASILLIRIEGDVALMDCENIIDEFDNCRRNDDILILDTCTYIPEYKSNTARVSIWYQC